jgi:hypothetical protein
MGSVKRNVAASIVLTMVLLGVIAMVLKKTPRAQTQTAPMAAQPVADLTSAKTIRFEAHVGEASSWNPGPKPEDVKQVKEEFHRYKTPEGEEATFKGRVEGLKKIEGAEVGIVTMRGVQWTNMQNYQWEPVKPDGTFSITSARFPDQKRVLAVRPSKSEAATFLRTQFDADESADGVVLRVKPTKPVTIRVKNTKGVAVAFQVEQYDGYTVQDDDGNNLEMQRLDVPRFGNGKLTLALPEEPVALYIGGKGIAPYYKVIDPRQADEFEFKLLSSAIIKGTVTHGGKPVQGAVLFLINDAAPLSAAYRRTDKDGHYVWPNGVPGTYRVSLKDKHEVIDVAEGQTGQVDFELDDQAASTQAAQ